MLDKYLMTKKVGRQERREYEKCEKDLEKLQLKC